MISAKRIVNLQDTAVEPEDFTYPSSFNVSVVQLGTLLRHEIARHEISKLDLFDPPSSSRWNEEADSKSNHR